MTKNRKSTRDRVKRRDRASGPPVGATAYKGPLYLTGAPSEQKTTTALLSNVTTITVLNTQNSVAYVLTSDPTGFTEWNTFAGLYDSYRVLAMEIEYLPQSPNTGGTVSATTGPCVVVADYSDIVGLSSIAGAIQYDSFKQYAFGPSTTSRPGWKFNKWKANGTELMAWNNTTGSPSAVGSIKAFFQYPVTVGGNTDIGYIVGRVLVQFRGRT